MKPCDVEGIEDFFRYYRYSFIPYKDMVCQVMLIDGNRVMMRHAKDGISELKEVHTTWDELSKTKAFGVPRLGLRNFGPTIAYFSQFPARQSQRGYIPGSTQVHQFNSWESRKVAKPTPDSWEIAHEMFFPKFYEKKEAVELLESGKRIGCALTPNVGVYSTSKSRHVLVSHKQQTVGYLDGEDVVILSRFCPISYNILKDLKVKKFRERTDSGVMVEHG